MRRALLPLLLFSWTCAEPGAPRPAAMTINACTPGVIDRPQALRFVGETLVVASTGFDAPWRPGRLTMFALDTGRALWTAPTSGLNPQALAVHGDAVLAADTGAYDYSGDLPRMATPGGLDVLLPEASALSGFELHPRADGRGGGPIDLAVIGDRAFLSSGLAPEIYLFDLAAGRFLRDATDPIRYGDGELGLGALATWRDRVLVVDYNSDRLHVLDGATGEPAACAVDLGESAALEGAKAPTVSGDDLYVALDHAGVVRRFDLRQLPADPAAPCPDVTVETVITTGLLPNHLLARDGVLYVVHSGDNNVVGWRLDDFQRIGAWILPPGSNPWAVAAHPRRPLLAVSEWQADGVTLIDLETDEQTRLRCGAVDPQGPQTPDPTPRGDARLADEVRSSPSADDGPFGDPTRAINGVRGAGATAGGQDVLSLGTEAGVDDHVVLCWSGAAVPDGPGPDIAVFENPFQVGGAGRYFMDPVIVEASADGETWAPFPHDYLAPDEREYVPRPTAWRGFAGLTPVRLHDEDAPMDPLSPAAGGDRFDLGDLEGEVGASVRSAGARCVRLTSAQARINPDTDAPFPADPVSDGADIDGVYGRAPLSE